MNNNTSNALLLVGLLLTFFGITFVSNTFLRGLSFDLSADKRYSLTDGTQSIINELEEPIELYFFYSKSTTKSIPSLRNYALQVEALLKKYDQLAGDKIRLQVVDPEPFSEQEDKAAEFGLTSARVGPAQDSVYFGLAGTNNSGDVMIIGFFDPNLASLLEYDISRLIYQLSSPEPIQLTIVTDIAMTGQQNPLTGESAPPFVLYQQFEELFDVTLVSNSAEGLPTNTDVLLVAHPQQINTDLLYAIDQYLMAGGKGIVLLDPHFESDTMAMMGSVGANSSDFPLLGAYAVSVDLQQVVLDSQTGLEVSVDGSQTTRHFGFLGLSELLINSKDVATGDLDLINGASFGNIQLLDNANLSLEALISSSDKSSFINANEYSSAAEPNILTEGFNSDEKAKVLAARITGSAPSYFTQREQRETEGFLSKTDALNIVVIADADIMTDRFWVQSANFFGEVISTPFASNGDLLINLVENYGGAEALIGLRGRNDFAKPFDKVAEIRVDAEAKFREQERQLSIQLQETEAQLAQLQSQPSDATASASQQAAIDEFVAKRIKTRKALREVQFQLQRDINRLGNKLKLINIVVMPIVLTCLLFGLSRVFRARYKKQV